MKSLAELATIKAEMQSNVAIREGKEDVQSAVKKHVLICGGTGCTSSKSVEIKNALEAEIDALGLKEQVKVVLTGCFGLCALGPIMIVYPEGTFYHNVTVADMPEFAKSHLLNGQPLDRLVYYKKI